MCISELNLSVAFTRFSEYFCCTSSWRWTATKLHSWSCWASVTTIMVRACFLSHACFLSPPQLRLPAWRQQVACSSTPSTSGPSPNPLWPQHMALLGYKCIRTIHIHTNIQHHHFLLRFLPAQRTRFKINRRCNGLWYEWIYKGHFKLRMLAPKNLLLAVRVIVISVDFVEFKE